MDGLRLPLAVAHNADRFGAPRLFLNGRFDCKVSARETDGRYCIFDSVRTRGGPALHIHSTQDEWFLVREGDFLFQVGEEVVRLGPGDSILAPRGIPHTFASTTDAGRLLIMFQPAGSMEEFFREGSLMVQPSREEVVHLHQRHGMDLVGPPIPVD